MQQKYRVLAQI